MCHCPHILSDQLDWTLTRDSLIELEDEEQITMETWAISSKLYAADKGATWGKFSGKALTTHALEMTSLDAYVDYIWDEALGKINKRKESHEGEAPMMKLASLKKGERLEMAWLLSYYITSLAMLWSIRKALTRLLTLALDFPASIRWEVNYCSLYSTKHQILFYSNKRSTKSCF